MIPRKIPDFAISPWYLDPRDHRCPLDAILDVLDISKSMPPTAAITIKLFNRIQDGFIIFKYAGVAGHRLPCYECDQGFGHWLRDEFCITDKGLIEHRITWTLAASGSSQWMIEAEQISFEWVPRGY
jgi:hypothetical protein